MENEIKELICIVCPRGCHIKAQVTDGELSYIEGIKAKNSLIVTFKSDLKIVLIFIFLRKSFASFVHC